jgi:primosomal protein N' (replication factor Y)
LIELKHRKEDKVNRASQFLSSVLQKYLPLQCILGPEKAPIGKINLFVSVSNFTQIASRKKIQRIQRKCTEIY